MEDQGNDDGGVQFSQTVQQEAEKASIPGVGELDRRTNQINRFIMLNARAKLFAAVLGRDDRRLAQTFGELMGQFMALLSDALELSEEEDENVNREGDLLACTKIEEVTGKGAETLLEKVNETRRKEK